MSDCPCENYLGVANCAMRFLDHAASIIGKDLTAGFAASGSVTGTGRALITARSVCAGAVNANSTTGGIGTGKRARSTIADETSEIGFSISVSVAVGRRISLTAT